jgi:hypothetical protein
MVARSSKIIALREAADKRRDNFYGRLHAIIRAWAGSGIDQMDAAATSLKTVFDLYKLKTSAQIDEESGQLDNLISDLSDADMQAALQTLGISTLYDEMVTAHQETKGYRLEQGVEESEKVTGALKEARQTTDAIYDELTYLIEAFAKTADDPAPYEAFIKRWNGTLKLYPQPGKNKEGSGSSSSSQDSDDSGNSGNTGNSGDSGNAGDAGDTGNTGTPVTPATPEIPETPETRATPGIPEILEIPGIPAAVTTPETIPITGWSKDPPPALPCREGVV